MSFSKSISTWKELSEAVQIATDSSGNGNCEPCGTIGVEELGHGIVHVTISVDLVPGLAEIRDEEIPF